MAPTNLHTSLVLLLAALAHCSPAALPEAAGVVARRPQITPPPTIVERDPTKTYKQRRDIFNDIESGIEGVLSTLGNVPSYVASGVPNFFQGFPTGDKVQSSLGIDDDQLAALPTQALNLPPYANFTRDGWNVRFHGNIYKQPNTSEKTLDKLANVFLIDTDISDLSPSEQNQARNLTAEIFVVQQSNVSVLIDIDPSSSDSQQVLLPYNTTDEGDFDVFVPIKSNGNITDGNATSSIQTVQTYVNGSTLGNATAYLVPNEGLTIISDIDDILRVTKIYEPKEGLLNSFARPFTPWMNMPEIYANWSKSIAGLHQHYLTTTPEQITRNYMQFIYDTYPAGSFDTRPLNFSDVSATLSIRKYLLDKIFATFPQRKFVLVADTSNSDVMRDYPQLAHDHPDQVKCIFLRNTSATDDGDKFPYDTSGFKGLSNNTYMFFLVPDDLKGLDIEGGQCLNSSVKQNVTFGIQDEALGIHGSAAGQLQVRGWVALSVAIAAASVAFL